MRTKNRMELPSPSKRQILIGSLVLFAWILSFLIAFLFVCEFGLPIPFADEWSTVYEAVGENPVTLNWLWKLHNEHRLPLHRLIYVGLYKLTGSFRSGMFFNVFALGLISLLLVFHARRLRGKASITDVFLPLCLLSLAHYENLLWSNQIVFVVTAFVLCAVLILISKTNDRPLPTFPMGICLVLLALCGPAGMVPQIALLGWFVSAGIINYRRSLISKRRALLLALPAILAISISVLYFVDYHPVFFYTSFRVSDVVRGTMEFLSTSFGPAGYDVLVLSAAVVIALIFASFRLMAAAWIQRPNDRVRLLGIAFYLGGLILLTATIATGRSGGGPGFAAGHRYATLSASLLCGIYILWQIYGDQKWSRAVPALLLVLTILAIPENFRIAFSYAKFRTQLYSNFSDDLRLNLPIEALATRYMEVVMPYYGPFVPEFLRFLHDRKIGPFAQLTSPLPPVEQKPLEVNIPLTPPHPEQSLQKQQYVFHLPNAKYLLGLRFSFVINNPQGRQPQLLLSWKRTTGTTDRVIRHPLPNLTTEQTLEFWLYDAVSQIGISAPNDRLELKRLTLLIEP